MNPRATGITRWAQRATNSSSSTPPSGVVGTFRWLVSSYPPLWTRSTTRLATRKSTGPAPNDDVPHPFEYDELRRIAQTRPKAQRRSRSLDGHQAQPERLTAEKVVLARSVAAITATKSPESRRSAQRPRPVTQGEPDNGDDDQAARSRPRNAPTLDLIVGYFAPWEMPRGAEPARRGAIVFVTSSVCQRT